MIRFIYRWWWARKRAIDLRILWPICKEQTGDLEKARRVFMYHALNDPCWELEYGDRLGDVIWELT